MSKHADLSASGSPRWTQCPGSVQLSKQCPPSPDNEASLTGTHAHALLELANRYPGLMRLNGEHPIGIAVEIALKFCNQLKKKVDTFEVEVRVDLNFIGQEYGEDMHGTCDILGLSTFQTLYVYDYKNGKKAVDVVNKHPTTGVLSHNTQLIYYALGAAERFGWDFEDVELGIIQPNAGKMPVKSAKLKRAELKAYIPLFKKAIARTKETKPKLFEGSWCFFCPAKGICPLITKKIKGRTAARFQNREGAND